MFRLGQKLKDACSPIKDVMVTRDMAKNERDECKRLAEEAQLKEEQEGLGEWIFRYSEFEDHQT